MVPLPPGEITRAASVRLPSCGRGCVCRSCISATSAIQSSTQSASKWPTYEDVTDKAKLHFRHSFGEQKLSSILEATGSGCVWFDYNNDGLLDLYVLSGRYIDGVTKLSKRRWCGCYQPPLPQ